jgi:hypothetical protein
MKEQAPERDDRKVVILWYEDVLGISEGVAKTLYNEQDLMIPEH